jgi:peptide/nickel transport system substrate-binding protein
MPFRPSRAHALLSVPLAVLAAAAAGCGSTTTTDSSSGSNPLSAYADSTGNRFFRATTGAPRNGGVLSVAVPLPPLSLTPWVGTDGGSTLFIYELDAGLTESAPNSTTPQPALAQSWTVSPDGLTYTFHLRPNLRFSNGQPITAQDVQFSLQQWANPNINTAWAPEGDVIANVTIVDAADIRVQLKHPSPAFLSNLAIAGAAIVPESIVKRLGASKFSAHPVGAGPFMISAFNPSSSAFTLKRNPYYWAAGQPHLSAVIFNVIASDTSRMLAVESGANQLATSVPYSQVGQVDSTGKVTVLRQTVYANDLLWINERKPPLANPLVRQALAAATPLQSIARVAFHGFATPAATANLNTAYLNRNLAPRPYSIATARTLLKQADVHTPISLTLSVVSGDNVGAQVATILQAAWAQAGIHLTIAPEDFGAIETAVTKETYDLAMATPLGNVSDTAVDDEYAINIALPALDGYFTHWSDPAAVRLITQATTETNGAQRAQDFAAYQRILQAQEPLLGLGYPANLVAVGPTVRDFAFVPEGWLDLSQTWLSG